MCFFFFKQKTAYEMRISDWSSDVLFRSPRGGGPAAIKRPTNELGGAGVRRRHPLRRNSRFASYRTHDCLQSPPAVRRSTILARIWRAHAAQRLALPSMYCPARKRRNLRNLASCASKPDGNRQGARSDPHQRWPIGERTRTHLNL